MKCIWLSMVSFILICTGTYYYIDNQMLHAYPEKPFVVVIPSYNNARWYKKNLQSVLGQQYSNYRVIYIDDCSCDDTALLVQQLVNNHKNGDKVQIIRNKQRQGVLANLYAAIHQCSPHEIIIDLDGDDWLKDDLVLKKINAVYQDSSVWMTYGQYETYPAGNKGICKPLPNEVIQNNNYRSYPWVTSHLRTFYAGLFHHIDKEQLLKDNQFYQVSNDQQFMFCLLERAGNHSYFINQVLYVYNTLNPLNEFRVRLSQEKEAQVHIRNRKRAEPLQEQVYAQWH